MCSETMPKTPLGRTHLELQARLDVLLQRLGDGLVEVAQDLHRQLRVDALIADEVVERIRQRKADAAKRVRLVGGVARQREQRRSTCYGGTARRKIVRQ